MLKLVDIHSDYGKGYVLQGVSLELKEGQVVGLLGRNGMGKTTTIHTIIGFIRPRRGLITFKGKDLAQIDRYRIPQMGIALVPQGRRIFPSLSVSENLTMARRGGGKPGAWSLDKVYSLFPILKERAKHKGNQLSGGEQQMLAIARALMTNPVLMLMDEPSEGLAPLVVRQLVTIINQLNESGISILLAEQNLNMTLRVTHYVYIMNKGQIAYEGTPEELNKNPQIQDTYLGVTV